MDVKINKEIRNYTESIVLGLTLRQCFFSVLACFVAVVVYFLFIDVLGLEVTSWLCIVVAIPFAALGFVSYQGMNFEKILINVWRSFLMSHRQLVFRPYNLYYEILKDYIENQRKESINPNDKKLRKIKKTKQRQDKSA